MNTLPEATIPTGTTIMILPHKLSACLAVYIALAGLSFAQAPSPAQLKESKQAHSVALKSLNTLRQLIMSPDELRALGAPKATIRALSAPAGASQPLEIGHPLKDYIIGLKSLTEWNGKDVSTLLHPTGRLVYPVLTRGIARLSVTLSRQDNEWKAVELGAPFETDARASAQFMIAREAPGAEQNEFQVRVPALNVVFIAFQQKNRLYFSAIYPRPSLGIKSNKPEQATEMMLHLQPIAKGLRPDVPN